MKRKQGDLSQKPMWFFTWWDVIFYIIIP